jgi:hypothetical protein
MQSTWWPAMEGDSEVLAQRVAEILLAGMSAVERDEERPTFDARDLPAEPPEEVWGSEAGRWVGLFPCPGPKLSTKTRGGAGGGS